MHHHKVMAYQQGSIASVSSSGLHGASWLCLLSPRIQFSFPRLALFCLAIDLKQFSLLINSNHNIQRGIPHHTQFTQCLWCEPIGRSVCFVVSMNHLRVSQGLKHMHTYTTNVRNHILTSVKWCVHLGSLIKLAITEHFLNDIKNNTSNINI